MRRWAALLVALILVLTATSAIIGCGSVSGQAKQCAQNGDELLRDYESQASPWSTQIRTLSANPETIAGEVQQVKSVSSRLLATTLSAKTEYEKILVIDDAGDYREYAELRIAELEILAGIINSMDTFLDERTAMVESEDLSFYPALQQKAQDEIDLLENEGGKLERKAEKLKADAGL